MCSTTPADAPILLLATARHELLEERPNWPDRPGATRLVLHPLTAARRRTVVTHLLGSAGLPPTVVERIVAAAEGNPLYVEQMLSMLIDSRRRAARRRSGLAGMAGARRTTRSPCRRPSTRCSKRAWTAWAARSAPQSSQPR